MGLLTSAIGIISSLTNFGLDISATKDILTANSPFQNQEEVDKVVEIINKYNG